MRRRLRSLGDDRRRRGEEQKFVRFHCLSFTPSKPDRSQFISDHENTEATNLARRAPNLALPRARQKMS